MILGHRIYIPLYSFACEGFNINWEGCKVYNDSKLVQELLCLLRDAFLCASLCFFYNLTTKKHKEISRRNTKG